MAQSPFILQCEEKLGEKASLLVKFASGCSFFEQAARIATVAWFCNLMAFLTRSATHSVELRTPSYSVTNSEIEGGNTLERRMHLMV